MNITATLKFRIGYDLLAVCTLVNNFRDEKYSQTRKIQHIRDIINVSTTATIINRVLQVRDEKYSRLPFSFLNFN